MKKLEMTTKTVNKPSKKNSINDSINDFFPKTERIIAKNPVNIKGVMKKRSEINKP